MGEDQTNADLHNIWHWLCFLCRSLGKNCHFSSSWRRSRLCYKFLFARTLFCHSKCFHECSREAFGPDWSSVTDVWIVEMVKGKCSIKKLHFATAEIKFFLVLLLLPKSRYLLVIFWNLSVVVTQCPIPFLQLRLRLRLCEFIFFIFLAQTVA